MAFHTLPWDAGDRQNKQTVRTHSGTTWNNSEPNPAYLTKLTNERCVIKQYSGLSGIFVYEYHEGRGGLVGQVSDSGSREKLFFVAPLGNFSTFICSGQQSLSSPRGR